MLLLKPLFSPNQHGDGGDLSALLLVRPKAGPRARVPDADVAVLMARDQEELVGIRIRHRA